MRDTFRRKVLSYYLAAIPRKDMSVYGVVYHLDLDCGHFENRKAPLIKEGAVVALDRSGYAERIELRFETPPEQVKCSKCRYAKNSPKDKVRTAELIDANGYVVATTTFPGCESDGEFARMVNVKYDHRHDWNTIRVVGGSVYGRAAREDMPGLRAEAMKLGHVSKHSVE